MKTRKIAPLVLLSLLSSNLANAGIAPAIGSASHTSVRPKKPKDTKEDKKETKEPEKPKLYKLGLGWYVLDFDSPLGDSTTNEFYAKLRAQITPETALALRAEIDLVNPHGESKSDSFTAYRFRPSLRQKIGKVDTTLAYKFSTKDERTAVLKNEKKLGHELKADVKLQLPENLYALFSAALGITNRVNTVNGSMGMAVEDAFSIKGLKPYATLTHAIDRSFFKDNLTYATTGLGYTNEPVRLDLRVLLGQRLGLGAELSLYAEERIRFALYGDILSDKGREKRNEKVFGLIGSASF